MPLNLTAALQRAAALLGDAAQEKWTPTELTCALRSGLGEMNLAAGQPLALEGLDGAAVTSLPESLEQTLCLGAAGIAALARAAAQADWPEQPPGQADPLRTWGEARLADFRAQCRQYFGASEPRRTTQPWAAWESWE